MKGYFQTSRKLVCVSPIPLSSPWWNALTVGKYGYGNVGQSVCLCVCVLVSGQTGGSSLPRWSAGIKGACQYTPWVAKTHTFTYTHTGTHTQTHSLCGRDKDNDSEKHLWCAPFWQQSKVCAATTQTCKLLTGALFLLGRQVSAI